MQRKEMWQYGRIFIVKKEELKMRKVIKTLGTSIIAPVIVEVIAGMILAKNKDVDFISALFLVIKETFKFLYRVFNFKLSLWFVVASILIFMMIKNILKAAKYKKSAKSNKEILLEAYTEDIYSDMNYRWRWCNTSSDPQVINLTPICKCGCVLDYDVFDLIIECPDCKKEYSNSVDERAAERTFENRFRKKLKELENKEEK